MFDICTDTSLPTAQLWNIGDFCKHGHAENVEAVCDLYHAANAIIEDVSQDVARRGYCDIMCNGWDGADHTTEIGDNAPFYNQIYWDLDEGWTLEMRLHHPTPDNMNIVLEFYIEWWDGLEGRYDTPKFKITIHNKSSVTVGRERMWQIEQMKNEKPDVLWNIVRVMLAMNSYAQSLKSRAALDFIKEVIEE